MMHLPGMTVLITLKVDIHHDLFFFCTSWQCNSMFARIQQKALLLFSAKLSGYCKLRNHEAKKTLEVIASNKTWKRWYCFNSVSTIWKYVSYLIMELRSILQHVEYELALRGVHHKLLFGHLAVSLGVDRFPEKKRAMWWKEKEKNSRYDIIASLIREAIV